MSRGRDGPGLADGSWFLIRGVPDDAGLGGRCRRRSTSLDRPVLTLLVAKDVDVLEPEVRKYLVDGTGLLAADLEEHPAAGSKPPRGHAGGANEQSRSARPAVQRLFRFMPPDVARQQVQLLGRDVRDHRG